jgi:hypothetical protein
MGEGPVEDEAEKATITAEISRMEGACWKARILLVTKPTQQEKYALLWCR